MRAVAWIASSVILAGCSAASYQKQVADLSDGLANVKSSFNTLSQSELQAFIASQTALALQVDNQIIIPETCSAVQRGEKKSSIDCIPRIVNTKTQQTRRLVYKSAAPNALKLADSIASYGESLVALTQAKDVGELKEALGKAQASMAKLAVDAEVGGQSFGVTSAFVSWAVGKYLDELRFEQLRTVVSDADHLVGAASTLLVADAKLLRDSIIIQKSTLLQDEQLRLAHLRQASPADATVVATTANTIIADATALQSLADTDITKPFVAMRKAHAALLVALNNPEISVDQVFAQINDFIDQASKLKSGLESSEKAKQRG